MDDVAVSSNPYQSPSIAADERPIRVSSGGSRALHIAVVGIGAALGGFAMFGVYVLFFWLLGTREFGRLLQGGQLVATIPIGAVVGGLFAKWCALQFRPLR